MPQFSHSKLGTFENCPLRYRYKYIEKREAAKGDSIEAFMGSRVHDALEKLYTDLKYEKKISKKELLESYNKEWKKKFSDDIIIVKEQYSAENYRQMGEKALATYYDRFAPFDQATTLACEKRITIPLDPKEKQYELIGYIDRLDKTEDGVYEIHDYKTSGTLPDQDKVDADRQLALYALSVLRDFKDVKRIRLIWHYLLFDVEKESERSEEDLEKLRKETLELAKKISKISEFPPKVSALCSWCEFQPLCPEWKHKFKAEELEGNKYRNEPGVKLVNTYARLNEEKKDLEMVLEKLKQAIYEFAEKEHVNVVFGTDVKARIWRKDTVKLPNYDDPRKEELVKTLKLLGRYNEVTRLDTWGLAKIIDERRWPEKILEQLKPYYEEDEVKRIYLNKKR